jgi:hypothetical protein
LTNLKQVHRGGEHLNLKPYITTPDNAEKITDWLRNRGGIAIWQSIDLGRAGQTLTTPVNTSTGEPCPKPAYWVGESPACIITDFADVLISKDVEVKRFHVAVRTGDNGLRIKCTDGATRRIRAAVAKAGEDAYYVFDYMTQEAVILKPEAQLPLLDYLAEEEKGTNHALSLRLVPPVA